MTGASLTIGSLADAAGNPTGHQVVLASATLTQAATIQTRPSPSHFGNRWRPDEDWHGHFHSRRREHVLGRNHSEQWHAPSHRSLAPARDCRDQTAGHTATLTGAGTINGAVIINGPGASGNGGTIAGVSARRYVGRGLTFAGGSFSSFTLGTPNGTSV